MTLTEKEIFSQGEAIIKARKWFCENADRIRAFLRESNRKKIVFFGCGSSLMLSKSGAAMFSRIDGMDSYFIAGGDFLINPAEYRNIIRDSIVVFLSRSGLTSEIVQSARVIRKEYDSPIVSFTMKEDTELENLSDFPVVFPWAYDESVCQTRTVTVLYFSLLALSAVITENKALWDELGKIISYQEKFFQKYREGIKKIATKGFRDVIVLADGVVHGLAQEGALAFTEIAMIKGQAFHLLDYRHGPKVLNGQDTLTIILLRENEDTLQNAMVLDMKENGGFLIVIDQSMEDRFGVDLHISAQGLSFPLAGFPLINTCQMLALETALSTGVNPDKPEGLDSYITL